VFRIVLLISMLMSVQSSMASEAFHPHYLAIFAGPGVEEKKDHEENTYAVGLEYEYRINESIGLGVVYETLGKDTVRNEALVIPFSVHLGKGWRLFAGPGYEWHDRKEKLLFRVGAGYGFHLGGQWSITPEAYIDFIENGDRTWIAGLAVGYHF
jgi:hypothetical protein